MFEIILSSVIVALLVEIAYLTKGHQEEIDKLVKALIAKNLQELTTSEIIKEKEPLPVKEEPVPLEQADDSVFTKYLKQVNNGQEQPEI
jgi:hypothetical protein